MHGCVQGCYAGAPNLSRCRQGVAHECKFIALNKLQNDFPTQCKPDKVLPSAIGGITEYNSYAFGGAYRGQLFIAGYSRHTIRFNPNTGKDVPDKSNANYPASPGLDIIHAPGGVHIVASFKQEQILFNVPVDATLVNNGNPSVFDIMPDRGMKAQPGPNTFIIGGANFNALQGARLSSSSLLYQEVESMRDVLVTALLSCSHGATETAIRSRATRTPAVQDLQHNRY